MSEIVNKMLEEIIHRSNEFEKRTTGTKDQYNLFNQHVQYVYKYADLLSYLVPVDKEIVQLSSLLHDISMTDDSLDRSKHNEFSVKIAEELLMKANYSEKKIELVKKCILNHSSKRKEFRTTLEEQVLVDADAMAHFDCLDSLYSLAHNVMGLNEIESIQFIKDKLTRDYIEISDVAKNIVKDKYEKVIQSSTFKDIKQI